MQKASGDSWFGINENGNFDISKDKLQIESISRNELLENFQKYPKYSFLLQLTMIFFSKKIIRHVVTLLTTSSMHHRISSSNLNRR